jgi:hypothetical protein
MEIKLSPSPLQRLSMGEAKRMEVKYVENG